MQTLPNNVESTQPPGSRGQAFPPDPLPNDPAYLPHALLRFAPQMDCIGLPQNEREPFLRDLSTLVASALDALYPTSFADADLPAVTDAFDEVDKEPIP